MQYRKGKGPKASDSSHDFRNYGMSEGEVEEYKHEKSGLAQKWQENSPSTSDGIGSEHKLET